MILKLGWVATVHGSCFELIGVWDSQDLSKLQALKMLLCK